MMKELKVIICDGSKDAEKCKWRLEELAAKYRVPLEVQIMTTGRQLLFYLDTNSADVDFIYLEYHLPDQEGLELAKVLREKKIYADIIFYTNDKEHSLSGYLVEALYYLLKKETDKTTFERVFLRAVKNAKSRNEEMLLVSNSRRDRKIAINSISYFEINKNIVTVHFGNNETFAFYSTMAQLEKEMGDKGFVRIHQAYLVAVNYIHIKTLHSITLINSMVLPVGRSYQKNMAYV